MITIKCCQVIQNWATFKLFPWVYTTATMNNFGAPTPPPSSMYSGNFSSRLRKLHWAIFVQFLIGNRPANPDYNVVPGPKSKCNPGTFHTWLVLMPTKKSNSLYDILWLSHIPDSPPPPHNCEFIGQLGLCYHFLLNQNILSPCSSYEWTFIWHGEHKRMKIWGKIGFYVLFW